MSALSVADVLERAADLIEPEGAWTQGAYARDMFGADVNPDEAWIAVPDATCWCLYGALAHVSPSWLESTLIRQDSFLPSTDWNDAPGRTQAEVVAKLREAAALARLSGASPGDPVSPAPAVAPAADAYPASDVASEALGRASGKAGEA